MLEDIRLTPEEINAAFDSDFGEVYFDHQPTADEIMLIKLKLVANTATDKANRWWLDYLERNALIGDFQLEVLKKKLVE